MKEDRDDVYSDRSNQEVEAARRINAKGFKKIKLLLSMSKTDLIGLLKRLKEYEPFSKGH